MYLKSQCARNHGNQVQSQPHGSEPLSPQNKKEKRKNQRTHKKGEKRREKPCIPEKKEKKKPKSPTYTPGNPSALIQQNKKPTNQKTKNLRIKEPKHPRPDHQPSPDALCTDPYKNPQPLSTKNQRISHYSLLIRSPPVSPCSELVAHRPSGSHSD